MRSGRGKSMAREARKEIPLRPPRILCALCVKNLSVRESPRIKGRY
jgi:hypothetical protein